jgi:hypothetical protein
MNTRSKVETEDFFTSGIEPSAIPQEESFSDDKVNNPVIKVG